MKFEEIKKRVVERNKKELILREQIDKKLQMLIDGRFSKDESYKMLAGKIVDFRTLKRWHTGTIMRTNSFNKLVKLIEEGDNNVRRT